MTAVTEITTYAAQNLDLLEKLKVKIINFLPTLLLAVVIFVVGILLTKLVVRLMEKALNKSKLDITAHGFLKSLIRIVLYTLVAVIVLSTLGVQTSSIVAVIGAAGLAVGLALQNSLSNLAGGFIILFSKPFSAGDFIETNGVTGTVASISILTTRLLMVDNKVVYIPNGQVSGSKIINYTQEKKRRLDLIFAVSYQNDFEKAIEIIQKIIGKSPYALSEPAPLVRLNEHGANSLNITAQVWVNSGDYLSLKFELLAEVKKAFDKAGIQIPYNLMNIHVSHE